MKTIRLSIIILISIIILAGQNIRVTIEMTNGNNITGVLISEDSSSVVLNTDFGELTIPRQEIVFIKRPFDQMAKSLALPKIDQPELNQEARWRTIYSSMLIGNSIYGIGIPYVLGVEDFKVANGMRLLMFGGGFYASLRYTKQMNLPTGRWELQMAGAELAGLSIFPLMAVVGFENWTEFDKEGKIAWTYVMATIPFGIWKADQYYTRWKLSNGQATLVANSMVLGTANTVGLIALVHSDDWEFTENLSRIYTLLTYSGAVVGGFLAKNKFAGKIYSEDDAFFISSSATVGFFNGLLLNSLLDIDERKPFVAILLAGTNGFTYLANHLTRQTSLQKGQGIIVILGTGASYLIWLGTAAITGIDYRNDSARLIDIASITAGWYFTYQWVSRQNPTTSRDEKKQSLLFSFAPTLIADGTTFLPAINLCLRF
ncbi:MAG: hypothetical protein IIB45_09065 [Candidatus Marinimicrobia bacterium]|nr:hypothetical protein [Candidatus Neomarinimicrobiota bacterium]